MRCRLLIAGAVVLVLAGCGTASADNTPMTDPSVAATSESPSASPSVAPPAQSSPSPPPTAIVPDYTDDQIAGYMMARGDATNGSQPLVFDSPVMTAGWGVLYEYQCATNDAMDDAGHVLIISITTPAGTPDMAETTGNQGRGFAYAPNSLPGGSYRMGVAGDCQFTLTFIDLRGKMQSHDLTVGPALGLDFQLITDSQWSMYWSFWCSESQDFTITDTTTHTTLVDQVGTLGAGTYNSSSSLNSHYLHIAGAQGCYWGMDIRSPVHQ